MRTAIQLYSVRAAAASDLPATLEAVAALGLDEVEVADLHGREPAAWRRLLDGLGLGVAALFHPLDAFEGDPAAAFDACRTLGTDRLVVPWLPQTLDPALVADHVARVARFAEATAAAGLAPGFHTHDHELREAADGTVMLDRLLAAAPALEIELDLGWAWVAGRDPGDVLVDLGERCRTVHVKDFADRDDPASFTAVGEGAVPFGAALRRAPGLVRLVAEQDAGFVPDDLAAAARSAAALLALRDAL